MKHRVRRIIKIIKNVIKREGLAYSSERFAYCQDFSKINNGGHKDRDIKTFPAKTRNPRDKMSKELYAGRN